jgi:hypothetical protein
MSLNEWLEERRDSISRRWFSDIRARLGPEQEEVDGFLAFFLERLVDLLLVCIGDGREVGEEVWQQATQLYGALAVRRGLAAGEVVEEIQLLRSVVLRFFLEDTAVDLGDRSVRKGLLALNRLVDIGVAQASITYVDELFFAHVQGSGVPEGVSGEVEQEIREQLNAIIKELKVR